MSHLITIVVPTYNRQMELQRLLFFFDSLGFKAPIIILDGSDERVAKENELSVKKYANVSHHTFPSKLHLGLRLYEGLKLVKTPFMAFCADDDYIFPDAAHSCVDFLIENQDYSAAIGTVYAMRYFPHKAIIRSGISLGNDLNHGERFNDSKFLQRAMIYFAYTFIGSIPLFYAVRRSEEVLNSFSYITSDYKYSSMEVLTNCLLLAKGKVAKLPISFGLRDYSSVTTRDPERECLTNYIPESDIKNIKKILINYLTNTYNDELSISEEIIGSILGLWEDPPNQIGKRNKTRLNNYIDYSSYFIQCLLSILVPSKVASYMDINQETYNAILLSHHKFSSTN